MKYKLLTRRVTLVIYSDHDEVNYTASCQININGNKGTIDTVNGKDFYRFIKEKGLQPFKDLGLSEVSGAISKAHFRLMKRSLKGISEVIEDGEIYSVEEGKIDLIWVTIPIV
jgi:hypothetical protein